MKLGTLNVSALESASAQKNLQVLDLKDNKISQLPAEVFHSFTQVKVLDLRKNTLEELLADIKVMVGLEDLLLDQNRLREIPTEVCHLPKIKTLSLSQNVLVSLPKAVGEMSSLRSLSLGDNHLADIPAELGSCNELQTLYLHHNHFTKLPTALYKLENLSELALEWFRYTTPPLPRVIKGAEWKRIITKFLAICKEKSEKGDGHIVSCIEILSQFSQKTFDANAIDSKRRTRLHVACLEGHVGVAMSLAESGSKCDSLDCEGYSPLLVAVREEHPEIATALVRVGVDVNRGGGLFGSPLHVATVNFDPHMVLLLIRGRADVNQTDADGNTPLHVLMSVFDKGGKRAGAIGQILLRHNADCNMMNSDKWAPLHLAARRGQLRGICFVLSHIDSVDQACLKGTCSHQPTHKKSKSSRVRTCSRVFDLNLRGGSHLWTPLHLAGHACHVPVVQILIEAGADVFLRNIDGRTARHVSRGNLAISKLLRKAEDEWLWHRVNQCSQSEKVEKEFDVENSKPPKKSPRADDGFLEALKVDDDEDDAIEEIAKNIEGSNLGDLDKEDEGDKNGKRLSEIDGRVSAKKNSDSRARRDRIMEKCCDTHYTKAELQALQTANFSNAPGSIEDFVSMFVKLTQQGPRHRLPFLLSKSWVKSWKDFVPKLLDDEKCHSMLLQTSLVTNEDFVRMLLSEAPRDQLPRFGGIRNKEQETMMHVLCKDKGSSAKAYPSAATRADIVDLLLTVCPFDTFDLEARDHRGQTALHLAAQSGDIGLVQVLLEYGADPNAQEETTGWTPLHFAVAKAHYSLILQLLHHDATNVNQVDKFDWPPLLEACSRLDSRSTALLVNGGAHLGFRNQHQFDVLKAVDTSKKDLAAKRWMSCLVVSNGFRFEESKVVLNPDDRDILEKERGYYDSRQVPAGNPPFFVPDHLAPRCHSCKVLFSVTVRRYHCRSCGLVLCGDCFKWRATNIVALDERVKCRQIVAQGAGFDHLEDEGGRSVNESRLNAAVEMSMQRGGPKNPQGPPSPATTTAPVLQPGRGMVPPIKADMEGDKNFTPNERRAASAVTVKTADSSTTTPGSHGSPRSDDSFEDPPLAEELPAVGPPMSVVCPASMSNMDQSKESRAPVSRTRQGQPMRGGLSRERHAATVGVATSAASARMVRLCTACASFFEVGVGETYSMLQRKEALRALG
jgi:ankyrin repeat protein